jgi:hypothetical protein
VQWRRERFLDVIARRESSCLFRLEIQDGSWPQKASQAS